MKRQQQGLPIIPGMGFPGQRETRRSDDRTDFLLVLKQWAGAVVLVTVLFLLLVANILIIGPIIGYIAGIITSIVIYMYLRLLTYKQEQPLPTLGTIIGLLLVGVWLLAGYSITDGFWWDIRCTWEPRNKLLFVTFSALFLSVTFLPIYRFAQEIIDPNWSPTISIRPANWGVMWPWFKPPLEEPETVEVEVEVIKEVPRPYQVPAANGGIKTVKDDLDPSRVDESKSVIAPSGNIVAVSDLVKFVKLAPIHGATFRVWQKRDWKYKRWKDVVDVWKEYSVVSANGERSTTEIVVTDLREALSRLSSAFVEG